LGGVEVERHFTVRSTSRQTADIQEPLVASLREDPDDSIVRRLVLGRCVDNPKNASATLEIDIRHQRRAHLAEVWEDPDHYGPARLGANQEIRLQFSSAETLALYRRLEEWYALCAGGIAFGERSLSVVDENDVTILRGHERDILKKMLESGEDFWILLESLEPDLFTAAAVARLHQQRVGAVTLFEDHVRAGDWPEAVWQAFFERETWIFGHGLAYQFLDIVTGQPAYGGVGVNRRGLQLGDYLLATRATARFTVLVEIKKPQTNLLGAPYRGQDVFEIGRDVVGGVAQLQAASRTWAFEGARAEANQELLDRGIETYQPRSILVVGDTGQLSNAGRRRTFELFRQNLGAPEVLTFDELLERARFLVEQPPDLQSPPQGAIQEDTSLADVDDLPF
jgi:Domain of unknown function (DUF4263)